jgi:signal transduction histidine kinase
MKMVPWLFLLLFSNAVAAQDRVADSLRFLLPGAEVNQRVELLHQLFNHFREFNRDSARHYCRLALAAARAEGLKSAEYRITNDLAGMHMGYYEFDSVLQITDALQEALEHNEFPEQMGTAYEIEGKTLLQMGDLNRAMESLTRALKIFEPLSDTSKVMSVLLGLASIYYENGDFSRALEMYDRLIAYHHEKGDAAQEALVLFNKGTVFYEMQEFEKAQQLFLRAAAAYEQNPKFRRRLINIYAAVAMGYTALQQPEKEQAYYGKALNLAREFNNQQLVCNTLVNMAKSYALSGQRQRAMAALQEAESLLANMETKNARYEFYDTKKDFALISGDYSGARRYELMAQAVRDSITNEEVAAHVAEMEVKYETEKKEKGLAQQQLLLSQKDGIIFRQRVGWGMTIGIAAMIALLAWMIYHRRQHRQQLMMTEAVISEQTRGLRAVIEAQENERKRIARDLHDGISQQLVAIQLGWQLLERNISSTSAVVARQLQQLNGVLHDVTNDLRKVTQVMSPRILEERGLISALENLFHVSFSGAGIRHQFIHDSPDIRFDPAVEVNMYRVAQELVNNILKHAAASEVQATLKVADSHLTLTIDDNGQGFDIQETRNKNSTGLSNILIRVGLLNGTFDSTRNHPHGTVSMAKVPVIQTALQA